MALLEPTEVTAPVAGTTAGMYRFTPPARSVSVDSGGEANILLRFDGLPAEDANGGYTFRLNQDGIFLINGDLIGVSYFRDVSVWAPAGADVTKIRISGER